jgi:hypothetical protein
MMSEQTSACTRYIALKSVVWGSRVQHGPREPISLCSKNGRGIAFIEGLDGLFRINYGPEISDRKRTEVHKIMSGIL